MGQEVQFCSECDAFGVMPKPPGRVGVAGQKCRCGKQMCRKNVGSIRLDRVCVWESEGIEKREGPGVGFAVRVPVVQKKSEKTAK